MLATSMNAATLPRCLPRDERRSLVAASAVPRQTISFYRYVTIADPKAFRDRLFARWSELNCLGRIYVAKEGINAQMNVPNENWGAFEAFVQSIPELTGIPYKIAVEESVPSSFYKLAIKVKDRIVADGITDETFDPSNTGPYLTAAEMNAYIDDPDAVVVDMRNGYESEVGKFDNAITPEVDTFREELAIAPELLKIHKNKKIALYCTGGIRCEKASAWLKHNGFTDVRHLKGGIIDYKRQVEEEGLQNRFKGKNFVFDERLGERISDEVIATCHLCAKTAADNHYHCKNEACHVLFIGCDTCVKNKRGYCSQYCRAFEALPASVKKWLVRNNHKKKLEQFRKHRMRLT